MCLAEQACSCWLRADTGGRQAAPGTSCVCWRQLVLAALCPADALCQRLLHGICSSCKLCGLSSTMVTTSGSPACAQQDTLRQSEHAAICRQTCGCRLRSQQLLAAETQDISQRSAAALPVWRSAACSRWWDRTWEGSCSHDCAGGQALRQLLQAQQENLRAQHRWGMRTRHMGHQHELMAARQAAEHAVGQLPACWQDLARPWAAEQRVRGLQELRQSGCAAGSSLQQGLHWPAVAAGGTQSVLTGLRLGPEQLQGLHGLRACTLGASIENTSTQS